MKEKKHKRIKVFAKCAKHYCFREVYNCRGKSGMNFAVKFIITKIIDQDCEIDCNVEHTYYNNSFYSEVETGDIVSFYAREDYSYPSKLKIEEPITQNYILKQILHSGRKYRRDAKRIDVPHTQYLDRLFKINPNDIHQFETLYLSDDLKFDCVIDYLIKMDNKIINIETVNSIYIFEKEKQDKI